LSSEAEGNEFRQDLLRMVEGFVTETSEMKQMMGQVSERLETVDESLDYMNKVVRDGNGRPPLITRMELLDQRLTQQEKVADRWWQVWVAAVPGVVALITGLII